MVMLVMWTVVMVAVVIKSICFKDFIDDGSICGVGSGGGVTIGFGGSTTTTTDTTTTNTAQRQMI